jgi:hypothetical protein
LFSEISNVIIVCQVVLGCTIHELPPDKLLLKLKPISTVHSSSSKKYIDVDCRKSNGIQDFTFKEFLAMTTTIRIHFQENHKNNPKLRIAF